MCTCFCQIISLLSNSFISTSQTLNVTLLRNLFLCLGIRKLEIFLERFFALNLEGIVHIAYILLHMEAEI